MLARVSGVVHLDQYTDLANSDGVEIYLVPQILEQLKQATFEFAISTIGAGGTAAGLGKGIENAQMDALLIGVKLEDGEKVSGMRDGERLKETRQPYQRYIGDRLISVLAEPSRQHSQRLNTQKLHVGTSTGAGMEALYILGKNHAELFVGRQKPMHLVMPCPDAYSPIA